MPFNGAGVFQRVRNWVADAAGGIKIRADFHDSEDDGFAEGLSNCIARDGQSIITQNIPWNSKRITGLEDPVNDQDAVTKKYVDTAPKPADIVIEKTGPTLILNDTGEAGAILAGQKDGLNRWVMHLGDGAVESGANVGSNFDLLRYADDGTVLGLVMAFNRATGIAAIPGQIDCGPIYSTGLSHFVNKVLVQGAGRPCFALHNTTIAAALGCWVDTTAPTLLFGNLDGNADPFLYWLGIGSGNGLFCNMAAFKPGGGPWADSSDARIKNVIGSYTSGLDAVTALNPTRFTYKGNDTPNEGGQSPHHAVAADGTEFIGLIAQEVEAVMPELVTQRDAYIDGTAVTDLRLLDTTPLIYALINSIKELKARVEALEGP